MKKLEVLAYIARKNNCRAERSVVIDDLVYLKNEQAVCDSLQVAEKFEMRHDNVLRAIDNLQKSLFLKICLHEKVVENCCFIDYIFNFIFQCRHKTALQCGFARLSLR